MDRSQEVNAINALQDKIADKYAPRLAEAISDAMQEVARGLPTGGRADPPLDHFARIETTMRSLYREITREQAASMVDRFKSGFEWLETKAEEDGLYARLYEEYLAAYGGQRIAQISEATRRQIVRIIDRGLKEGLTLNEIAAEITEAAPIVGEARSIVISRTETHSASMYASLQSAKRSTVPLVKEWVSVEDGRVRDFGEGDGVVDKFSHRAMNGVQVPLDDPFEVPTSFGITEQLMYPGDPSGSPANIINCRCAQVYDEADEDEEDVTPPTPVAKPVAGDARERLRDRVRGAQPVFSAAQDGAMDAAPLLYWQVIDKAGDFGRIINDRRGAYYQAGSIAMGSHNPGGEDYKRVFRHEHGHFIDDKIGQALGTPPFGSWRTVQKMLEDGDELRANKTKAFQGDKVKDKQRADKMAEARLDRIDALSDEMFGEDLTADDMLKRYIPEVEPKDIARLYGTQTLSDTQALDIVDAWTQRDAGQAIGDLVTRISGKSPSHSSGFAGLQDTFEAATGGNVRIWFGHGKKYYSERNSISDFRGQTVKHGRAKVNAYATGQAFANFMDAYGDPNPATYALYKRLYPRTAEDFEAILQEYVNA